MNSTPQSDLNELKKLLEGIQELVKHQSHPASEIILDDVDLRNLLKISRRTALEYRKRKVFPYYRFEEVDGSSNSKSKIYYILAEVIEGIKKNGGQHGK